MKRQSWKFLTGSQEHADIIYVFPSDTENRKIQLTHYLLTVWEQGVPQELMAKHPLMIHTSIENLLLKS